MPGSFLSFLIRILQIYYAHNDSLILFLIVEEKNMEKILQVGPNKFLKNIDVKQLLINAFGGLDKYKYVILCNPVYSDFFEPKVKWHDRYKEGKAENDRWLGYGIIEIDDYVIQVIEDGKIDDVRVRPISIDDDNTVN